METKNTIKNVFLVDSLTTYFAKIQTSWSIKYASFLTLLGETGKHEGLAYRTCIFDIQ